MKLIELAIRAHAQIWIRGLRAGVGVVSVALLAACSSLLGTEIPPYPQSPQFGEGRFQNPVPRPKLRFWDDPQLVWTFFFNKPDHTTPQRPIPVRAITQADLAAAPDHSVYRLGHSTLLLKMRGKFWITDPVFSERASLVQWAGPKRFHAPPIALEDLPPLEAVIVSHNHFDHLDHDAMVRIAPKARRIITPLGVGDLLQSWGVEPARITQLDWWQETDVDGVRVAATPAQHFSGRGLRDEDKSLWASWVIAGPDFRLFFGADSGYFDGFKTIGERYGPFDMAFLDVGAYDRRWTYVHMSPEEAVQAHIDLKARWLLPIHNGTFDLALHPWQEPLERVTQRAQELKVQVSTPIMGERVGYLAPHAGSRWWQND
jgi:L-ascorbate metabolism protein UlaG (beta-lactamase superfamily)